NVVIWLAVPSTIAGSPVLPYLDALVVPLDDSPVTVNGLTYYWFFTDALPANDTRTIAVGLKGSSLGQFALQTGIFDGTSVLQSLSASQQIVSSSLVGKSPFRTGSRLRGPSVSLPSVVVASNPQPGDIVFE